MGWIDGCDVGSVVGAALGCEEGPVVGCEDGWDEGCDVGAAEGKGSPQLKTNKSLEPPLEYGAIDPSVRPLTIAL